MMTLEQMRCHPRIHPTQLARLPKSEYRAAVEDLETLAGDHRAQGGTGECKYATAAVREIEARLDYAATLRRALQRYAPGEIES